jgi:hypothetical protein
MANCERLNVIAGEWRAAVAGQRNLLGSLRKDPYLRSACSDRAIEYNQKLLAAGDQLSIELCRNPEAKFSVDDVPTALGKSCSLLVTPVDPNARELRLEALAIF